MSLCPFCLADDRELRPFTSYIQACDKCLDHPQMQMVQHPYSLCPACRRLFIMLPELKRTCSAKCAMAQEARVREATAAARRAQYAAEQAAQAPFRGRPASTPAVESLGGSGTMADICLGTVDEIHPRAKHPGVNMRTSPAQKRLGRSFAGYSRREHEDQT